MSASLAFITHILLNNNHITQQLAKEVEEFVQNNDLDYSVENNLPVMDSVINETLRLYPPQTTFISRCNPTQDFVYEDPSDGKHYTIPKGIQIQVALYQIHRDDNNYPNANHFNAYRFTDRSGNRVNMGTNGEYSVKWQPFGRGGRDCIGKTYARIVLKLILSNLLLKFRLNTTENTARDRDLEIVYKTATMTPKHGIYGSVSAQLP
ncbi:unnamed protein product [Medioppia subpectinata]|uniref:Cytochrome P450 n=1 Tax=Medioppia subpectinata TaxID=1979941 RepID=A0A7R9L1M4_9ACAR|nr:unnamed protein product [Medioppia subpectinata]CAG2113828.1 unnamed protein product [Medioppia subpectinata]